MEQFEQEILNSVKGAILASIKEALSGYSSPLRPLITKVIEEHSNDIYTIVNDSFKSVIATEDFKKTIFSEFEHKVAKMLVGQLSGQVEKAVHKIKQNPTLQAKMIVAIEDIIEKEGA
jgi:hypothetical protein